MAEYFSSLEAMDDLEHSTIRNTKIHKVLKAIVKLSAIPKDDEYHFKQRSYDLLHKWQKILSESADAGEGAAEGNTEIGEAKTNGEESKDVDMKDEGEEAAAEPQEEQKGEEVENGAGDEADGDDKMDEAEEDATPAAAVENGLKKTEEEEKEEKEELAAAEDETDAA